MSWLDWVPTLPETIEWTACRMERAWKRINALFKISEPDDDEWIVAKTKLPEGGCPCHVYIHDDEHNPFICIKCGHHNAKKGKKREARWTNPDENYEEE